MDKENYLISLFKNSFIGDDGAVVGEWVYSKDLFCEDIHFKEKWMSLKQIAKKAMLVNISDAIVMNAHPTSKICPFRTETTFLYHNTADETALKRLFRSLQRL